MLRMKSTEVLRVPKIAIELVRQFQDAQLARPSQPAAARALIELGWKAWMKQRGPQKEAADG